MRSRERVGVGLQQWDDEVGVHASHAALGGDAKMREMVAGGRYPSRARSPQKWQDPGQWS